MHRSRVTSWIVALLVASTWWGSARATEVRPVPVRFGVDSFILGAQVHVAEARGLFARYGVAPEVQVFSYGVDTLDAVLAGRTDFGVGLDFPTLARLVPGQLRIVSAIIEPDPGFHKLAVRSGIRSGADLAGKRLGIAPGTLQHYVSIRYLDVSGVPRSSVQFTPFSSLFEIVASLRAGRIDAAWVWGDGVEQAKQIPGVIILTDDGAAQTRSVGYMVVSRKMVEEQPDTVVRVLKALAEATDWMNANLEEASRIVARKVGAPQDRVLAEMRRENYTLSLRREHLETLDRLAAFMMENGILKQRPPIEQYVVGGPLREVHRARVDL